jgi:glucose-1-phosphate thymidylyltransferase
VAGLYVYSNEVVQIASKLVPSDRGELEITDVNRVYLRKNALKVELLGRGFAWLDMGTHESMQQAASYVQTIQKRQGFKIACVEEIAYRLGYISSDDLKTLAEDMNKNEYGAYLKDIATFKRAELAQ